MMLPNFTTVRFVQKDAPAFVAAMKKYAPNMKVEVVNGESNPQLQQSQVDAAITGGAKAIVLIAADPSLASGSLNAAKKAGVPLIAYEHEASGGPVTYYTQFGALKVGEAQGKNAVRRSLRAARTRSPDSTATRAISIREPQRGPGRISEAARRH
jgi:D-xylose transport system substrate-binding protein